MTTTQPVEVDIKSRIAAAVARDRAERYGPAAASVLSLQALGEIRAKPLVLDADLRGYLARIADAYGDEMLRLIEERDAAGVLRPERLEWMAAQADRWFEFGDAMRDKRTIKYAGGHLQAMRAPDADDV